MMRFISFAVALCWSAASHAQGADAAAPLDPTEIAQFQQQTQACWNVKRGGTPSVTLRFKMARDGRPVAQSVQLSRHSKASEEDIKAAFALAKRAVLRCGRDGYTLPVEKYAQWRDIELTFDPERTISK